MNLDLEPALDYFASVAHSATLAQWLWQLAAVAAAMGLGGSAARALARPLRGTPRWKLGKGDFERVAFPLFALLLVTLERGLFAHYRQPAVLVDVARSLLMAFLVIRLAVFMLGHVLPDGAFLRSAVRFVAWIAWIAVVLHVAGLLPDVVDALNEVGFTLGKDNQKITLWLLLQGLAALAMALTVSLWIGRITEARVLAAETVQMSTRIVIAKLVRAGAVLVAILVALPLVGIDVTALSVFGGALGVGLGFGLQKIASNYVSGFIVLLDRSLRIGDVVTVDGRRGEVKAIESRYTVVKALDGTESIIPNETLITQTVIHHTYTDPRVLVPVRLLVAYESDVDLACKLLEEIARRHARVIADPPPASRVIGLADSGVDMQLNVWIADPEAGEGELKSDLLRDILRTFRDHGIAIPYPRRDVRLIATAQTKERASPSST